MKNHKDWKERFDKEFVHDFECEPNSGKCYCQLKDIKNFIDQIISERDKEIIEECGKVAYPGEDAFYLKFADVKKILQTLNK